MFPAAHVGARLLDGISGQERLFPITAALAAVLDVPREVAARWDQSDALGTVCAASPRCN